MKLIKKPKGFTLVELILTLGIISIISFLAFQKMSEDFENKQAAALGDQIKHVGMAVNNYIVNHYDVLSNLSNAAGSSLDIGPRTCDATKKTCLITTQTLVNEGLLPPAFTNKSIYSLGYNIELKRSGSSPYWNVTGLITTNNALLDRGNIRYDILGKAMLEAGVDSGMTRISANKLDGYKGSWSATQTDYSIVNKQGLLGYIAGYGSNSYSAFLRRDGTLPMTGDLNMGTKNIYNAVNITASGTGVFGGEVQAGSWVHARNGYGDQISLGGDAATNDYELKLSANKPLSIHGSSPVQINVSGALRATTDLTADRNISAAGTVSAGSWVNAKNGYGDQISLGGDAGGNDYELRISNPSKQVTVFSPAGNTKLMVTGTITAGEDIRANRNLSVGGTITASGNIKTNADLNANRVYSNYIKSNGIIDAAGAINATGRVSANEFLYLGKSAVEGAGCSPNGLQGRTATGAILSCVSGKWKGASGKIKSTQLSQNGYLGAFDVCAIGRIGNVEDSHYCQIYESPVGSRNWYKNDYKSGCIASCMSITAN